MFSFTRMIILGATTFVVVNFFSGFATDLAADTAALIESGDTSFSHSSSYKMDEKTKGMLESLGLDLDTTTNDIYSMVNDVDTCNLRFTCNPN